MEADRIQPPQSQGPSEASDAASTHTRLQRFVGKDHRSLGVLASLLEEHSTVWQDSSALDALADGARRDFFRFEDDGQVRAWFDGEIHSDALSCPPCSSGPYLADSLA